MVIKRTNPLASRPESLRVIPQSKAACAGRGGPERCAYQISGPVIAGGPQRVTENVSQTQRKESKINHLLRPRPAFRRDQGSIDFGINEKRAESTDLIETFSPLWPYEKKAYSVLRFLSQPTRPAPMLPNRIAPGAGMGVKSTSR